MSAEDYCPTCGNKLDPGNVYQSPAVALTKHECNTRVLGGIEAANTRAGACEPGFPGRKPGFSGVLADGFRMLSNEEDLRDARECWGYIDGRFWEIDRRLDGKKPASASRASEVRIPLRKPDKRLRYGRKLVERSPPARKTAETAPTREPARRPYKRKTAERHHPIEGYARRQYSIGSPTETTGGLTLEESLEMLEFVAQFEKKEREAAIS